MRADGYLRFELDVRTHGIIGIHMLITHEPARLVGANWQQSQIHAAEARVDVSEVLPVASVTREVTLPSVRAHDKSAPKTAVAVSRTACRPVLRRCHDHFRLRNLRALPPVELTDAVQAEALEEGTIARARDEGRRVAGFESQQCRDIKMVIVIVADEYDVNRRQIAKVQ